MPLRLNFSITESCDREVITFTDTTGDYAADANPYGFSTPNPDRTDYIALSGDISITDPNGDVYSIMETATGADRIEPLFEDPPTLFFQITMADLGGEAEGTIPDGVYVVTYSATITTDAVETPYSTSLYIMLDQGNVCCVDGMFADINACESCDDAGDWMSAFKARAFLIAARYAGRCGKIEKATELTAFVNKLCTGAGNCTSC